MSKSKMAASAATAKPCLDEPKMVSIPADIADQISETVYQAHRVLGDYVDAIVSGETDNGLWMGSEESALDLAIAMAARKGMLAITEELGIPRDDEAAFAGCDAAPEHVPGSLRFRGLPDANPEAVARAKLAARDAATGDTTPRAFEVDPEYASMYGVDYYEGQRGGVIVSADAYDLGMIRAALTAAGFQIEVGAA